jgi:hypothetical protein
MFLSVGLRFTALFMRVSLSNFEASLETVGAKVCTMLAGLLCSKSALPFEDSREGLSSAYLSNLVEEEFSEVQIQDREYTSHRAGAMRHLAGSMDRILPQDVVGLDRNSLW